jgi:hypothetical protein
MTNDTGQVSVVNRYKPGQKLTVEAGRTRTSTKLKMRGKPLIVSLSNHRGSSSTGSELRAVEEACREASRTFEPSVRCASVMKLISDFRLLISGLKGRI